MSAKAKANIADHNSYKNAKAHREMSIQREDNNKIAMQQLQDCHEKDLEEAYATADAETARCFALEEDRLRTEQNWKLKVREERHLHSANMAKAETTYKAEQMSTQAGHSFELSKAEKEFEKELKKQNKIHAADLKKTHKQLSKAKANLEKEKRGHDAVMQHAEIKWNVALKSNFAKASDTHEKNMLILKNQLDKKDAVLMEDREKNVQR